MPDPMQLRRDVGRSEDQLSNRSNVLPFSACFCRHFSASAVLRHEAGKAFGCSVRCRRAFLRFCEVFVVEKPRQCLFFMALPVLW
jgi:hypothetical protein